MSRSVGRHSVCCPGTNCGPIAPNQHPLILAVHSDFINTFLLHWLQQIWPQSVTKSGIFPIPASLPGDQRHSTQYIQVEFSIQDCFRGPWGPEAAALMATVTSLPAMVNDSLNSIFTHTMLTTFYHTCVHTKNNHCPTSKGLPHSLLWFTFFHCQPFS